MGSKSVAKPVEKVELYKYVQIYNHIMVSFSWSKYNPKFNDISSTVTKDSRWLLDVWHTALDGYTLDLNGSKEIRYELDKSILNVINAEKYNIEYLRAMLSFFFISEGLGKPTDFMHFVRLYLIGKEQKEPPKHIKEHMGEDAWIELIKHYAEPIAQVTLKQLNDLSEKDEKVSIKKLFPRDAIETASGKGRKKRSHLIIPKYLNVVAEQIIEDDKRIGEVVDYFADPSIKNKVKTISATDFYDDWKRYKFQILKTYLLKLAHDGFLSGDKRVKQVERKFTTKDLHENEIHPTAYDIVITFPKEQIERIRNTWAKNLPSKLTIQNFKYEKELWKKGDYYESIFK